MSADTPLRRDGTDTCDTMLRWNAVRIIVSCAVLGAALAACGGGGGATAALPSVAAAARADGSGQSTPTPAPSSPATNQSSGQAAPSGVGFDGQPVGTTFFANNALARSLSQNPRIDPQSAAMVAAMTVGDIGHLQFDPSGNAGTVVSTGHASDPVYSVRCLEPWGTCSATSVHVPNGTRSGPATDFHNAFIDAAAGTVTDSWLTCASFQSGGQSGAGYHGSPCSFPLAARTFNIGWGGSGALSSDGTGFGGTASSLSLVAGIVRPEDLLAGRMTHGVEIAVQCAQRGNEVYPAKGSDGKGNATCTGATAEPRYGQILWLDAVGEAETLGLNPTVLAPYIRAMHDFGFYIGDRDEGGSVPQGSDEFAPDVESNPAWTTVVHAIQSDPNAVDTSVTNGGYHITPRVPSDIRSHLFILDATCSQNGC